MAEITAIAPNSEGEMVVVNVAEQAIQKLEKELAANKEPYAQAIINYLIGRVKESNSLAMDVMQEHKTWSRCWDYIYSKASKAPRKGNCAAIEDKVVFEWAEDYYIKDDKAEAEKAAADAAKSKTDKKASKASGTDKKKAGKTVKAKEVKAEPDPVPTETAESAEPDEPKPEKAPKAEKPKKAAKAEKKEKGPKAPDRDAPDKKESKEKKKPKKDKQIEGQMSLEDLFGGF